MLVDSYLHAPCLCLPAALLKSQPFHNRPTVSHFQPMAFESLGSLNAPDFDFLCEVGRRLRAASDELCTRDLFSISSAFRDLTPSLFMSLLLSTTKTRQSSDPANSLGLLVRLSAATVYSLYNPSPFIIATQPER